MGTEGLAGADDLVIFKGLFSLKVLHYYQVLPPPPGVSGPQGSPEEVKTEANVSPTVLCRSAFIASTEVFAGDGTGLPGPLKGIIWKTTCKG